MPKYIDRIQYGLIDEMHSDFVKFFFESYSDKRFFGTIR